MFMELYKLSRLDMHLNSCSMDLVTTQRKSLATSVLYLKRTSHN